jgi:hypothetical protein
MQYFCPGRVNGAAHSAQNPSPPLPPPTLLPAEDPAVPPRFADSDATRLATTPPPLQQAYHIYEMKYDESTSTSSSKQYRRPTY